MDGLAHRGEQSLATEIPSMKEALTQTEGRLGRRATTITPPAPIDDATRKRLQALGYTF